MTKVIVFICGIVASIHSHADDDIRISAKIFNELESQNTRNIHTIYFQTKDNPELGKIKFSEKNEYFGPPNTGSTISSEMGLSPDWAKISASSLPGVDPSSGVKIYDSKKKKKKKK